MNKEIARNFVSLLYRVFDITITGQENFNLIREGKSAIIAFFPHTGHLDGPFVRAIIPKSLRADLIFPAGAEYWYQDGLKGKIMTLASTFVLPTFPMHRSGSGRSNIMASLNEAEKYLYSGRSVVFSPEGTRSNLPLRERALKTGVAKLAIDTHTPIIPITILGLDDLLPRGSGFPNILNHGRRRKLEAHVKEPIIIDALKLTGNQSARRSLVLDVLIKRFLDE